MLTKLKVLINKILKKLNQQLLARPYLRQKVVAWCRMLGVYSKLKTFQRQLAVVSANSAQRRWMLIELEHMTPRARQIYGDLKDAIVRQQKGED